MAAKGIVNELYQRLRKAVVYKTQADADGFVCDLSLPAVQCSHPALAAEQHFQGRGNSKKEAEHAAAVSAVEFLTAESVLWPDAAAAGSHSRGATSSAASPSASSATSGVSLPGVGSKRSKSNITDPLDEESAESLELRISEALTAVYPKPLNGAQLAKQCGHFKLKSKVNHLLYMKLRCQGLVELLDTHPPTWRAAGRALPAAAAPPQPHGAVGSTAAAAAAAVGSAAAVAGAAKGPDAAVSLEGSLTASASKAASAGAGKDDPTGDVSSAAPAAAAAGSSEQGKSAARAGTSAGAAAVGAGAAPVGAATSDSQRQPPQHRSSIGKQGSRSPAPAPSGAAAAAAAARPARSGSGLRGSCSPAPSALHNKRPAGQQHQQRSQHQQQQLQQQQLCVQRSGGVHSIMSPVQSDTSKHRRQQVPQLQQQQQQPQQHMALPIHKQQQGHLTQQQQLAGLDALLLPHTLSGLGLRDSADAFVSGVNLQATATAARVRGGSSGQGHEAAAAPVSGGLGAWSANSCGHEQDSSGAGLGAHSSGSQQQQQPQQTHSQGSLPSLPRHAGHRYTPAAAAGPAGAGAAAGTASVPNGAAAAAAAAHALRQGLAASDSDDEVSPAVLAAASEAASLEPAPFAAAEHSSGGTGSLREGPQQPQQQQRQVSGVVAGLQLLAPAGGVDNSVPQFGTSALSQHVDLLAAMHINERPFVPLLQQSVSQQALSQQQQGPPPQPQQQSSAQQQQQGPCSLDAVVPDSHMRARSTATSSRAGGEAGIKRKYPAYLSSDGQGAFVEATDMLAVTAAAHTAAASAGAAAAVQGALLASTSATDMRPAQQQQQQQEEQQQQVALTSQQQQHAAADADQVHPQRRRRRSGRGDGFTNPYGMQALAAAAAAAAAGRGAAGGSAAAAAGGVDDVVPMWQQFPAAAGVLGASEDEQTGSSDDMQDGDMQQGADGADSQGAAGAATAAAGLGACMQPTTGMQALASSLPGDAWHAQRQPAAAAAPAGGHLAAGSGLWVEQRLGNSSSNPWQSQQRLWRHQQQQQQQQQQQLQQPAAAAAGWQPNATQAPPTDSEGNGSCLSWPAVAAGGGDAAAAAAAVGANSQPLTSIWQQQQQQQQSHFEGLQPPPLQQQQQLRHPRFACTEDAEVVRASSPGPSMSGLSVGASAVSGGNNNRGSAEPMQAMAAAAAAGLQEVTQPAPQQLQQQQQQPTEDWLQSEEQALQLLSRLALPPAGARAGGPTHKHVGGVGSVHECGGPISSGTGQGTSGQGKLAAAMAAAAAAAAQAAAAVASAVPEQPQQQQQAPQAVEFERRVGAVRDLVQQLNEALQGLSNFQEQALHL